MHRSLRLYFTASTAEGWGSSTASTAEGCTATTASTAEGWGSSTASTAEGCTARTRAWTVLTVFVVTVFVLGTAAYADDEERRVVFRGARNCPRIEMLGLTGAPFLWGGLSSRGFLGVELTTLTPELRAHFGVPEDAGVMISRVVDDSAAAAAGLAVGDIIAKVGGEDMASPGRLGRAIRQQSGGDTVEIEYWRDGEVYNVDVILAEDERCAFDLGHLPLLERLGSKGLHTGDEVLRGALMGVDWGEALENMRDIDWEKQFEGLKNLDVEGLEERMEEVQERLRALEESLEREQERLERLERGREDPERDGGP